MKLSTSIPMIVAVPIVSATLLACGPSLVELDPRNVVNIHIAPATKQPTFCPGKAFKVEIIAKLKDGTSCSSTDRARGCSLRKGHPRRLGRQSPGQVAASPLKENREHVS